MGSSAEAVFCLWMQAEGSALSLIAGLRELQSGRPVLA